MVYVRFRNAADANAGLRRGNDYLCGRPVILSLTTAVVDSKECSGRGLCDEMTGTCVCMEGFGSSDGKGKKGTIQDCGYKLPLSAPVI